MALTLRAELRKPSPTKVNDFLQLLKGGVGIGSSVTFHKSYENNQVMFSWGLFSMTWPILLSIY